MKLLLRRSVEHVGKIGEIVSVSDGYGRNYLLPQGLGVSVTPDNKRMIEFEKVEVAKQDAAKRTAAEQLARSIEGVDVEITVKSQDDDTLYGSVNAHLIVDTLRKQKEIVLEAKSLKLPEPIKKLGEHKVEVRLHSEVTATIRVKVLREVE